MTANFPAFNIPISARAANQKRRLYAAMPSATSKMAGRHTSRLKPDEPAVAHLRIAAPAMRYVVACPRLNIRRCAAIAPWPMEKPRIRPRYQPPATRRQANLRTGTLARPPGRWVGKVFGPGEQPKRIGNRGWAQEFRTNPDACGNFASTVREKHGVRPDFVKEVEHTFMPRRKFRMPTVIGFTQDSAVVVEQDPDCRLSSGSGPRRRLPSCKFTGSAGSLRRGRRLRLPRRAKGHAWAGYRTEPVSSKRPGRLILRTEIFYTARPYRTGIGGGLQRRRDRNREPSPDR